MVVSITAHDDVVATYGSALFPNGRALFSEVNASLQGTVIGNRMTLNTSNRVVFELDAGSVTFILTIDGFGLSPANQNGAVVMNFGTVTALDVDVTGSQGRVDYLDITGLSINSAQAKADFISYFQTRSGEDRLNLLDGEDIHYTGLNFADYHTSTSTGGFGENLDLDGNDVLRLGGGADTFFSADGTDSLYGQQGADLLYAGNGNDRVFSGSGNDRAYGGDNHDLVYGAGGNDTLFGGSGRDTLNSGKGSDTLYGDGGDDRMIGGTGNDRFYGGLGDDTGFGGGGNDTFYGGKIHRFQRLG